MITITAFSWVPDFARGQVRDLRVRRALEEAGLAYQARLLEQGRPGQAGVPGAAAQMGDFRAAA